MNNTSIETQAQHTYEKNMLYFQAEHQGLYNQLTAFENALQNQYYTPKYELEYKQEGYFDVVELESGKWLYNMDSNTHADAIKEYVDFSKKDNLFETFRNLAFTKEMLHKYEKMDPLESAITTIAPIVNYTNQFANKETTMKKIYKFIFMGVGLGLHLTKLHEKLNSYTYFIVEDDLELFYLSLFVTDYKALTNNNATLIFSVFDDDDMFRYKTHAFLREMPVYNHYLKYFHLLSHSTEKLKIMHSVIISQDYLKFPHSAVMQIYLRPLDYIQDAYKYVNIEALAENAIFKNNPVLLLAAGPSLQNNIEWVAKHQNSFTIIAVTAAMGLLEKNNIKPDILIHVDGFQASMKHLEKVEDIHFFDESIKLFASFTYPEFAQAFSKENLYIFQAAATIKKGYGQLTASNVGIMSYALAVKFQAQELYALGLDMALDAKTGQTHLSEHVHSKKLDIDHVLDLEENINYHETVLKTEGNFQEEVPTTPHFIASLAELRGILSTIQTDEQKTYNLSNGAAIYKAIPKKINEINIQSNLQKPDPILKTTFERFSSTNLSDDERKVIQQRVKHATNILSLLNDFEKKHFSTLDKFHYDLLGLFMDILAEDGRDEVGDTDKVITLYIQMISGYIFDFINTKEISNPKKHIKKLSKLLTAQLSRLIKYYKKYLENFLEAIEKN
ncbi:hypothetical protein MNB_SM-6-875 [hydrothermal vent metagenome]|uniref:Motility accessory factor n=1 Tax=hydrothermal vent metagenome TaxID=652676 RepID=A0A1W1BM85_9ZZZZ